MRKKTTLLIGGTRGIGLAIERTLTSRGDYVYTASRSPASKANHININLPSEINIDKSVKLNYLIFSHRYRGENWDDDFAITVKAVDILINQLNGSFLDEAAIVILGSNAGKIAVQEQSASYHASRSALDGLMKYYAATLGSKGIRCNLVLPATVMKPENHQYYTKDNTIRQMIERITPLRRMGTAEDVANLVEFLCSEKSSFITGQSFCVDGGLSSIGQESIARMNTSQEYHKQKPGRDK